MTVPDPAADAATTETNASGPATTGPDDITTLVDLLDYAYAQSGKQVQLKAAVLEALDSDATDLETATQRAARHGATDPHLAVPPRLLAAVDRAHPTPKTRRRILEAVSAAVKDHPAFSDTSVGAAFRDRDDDGAWLLTRIHDHVRSAQLVDLGFPDGDAAERDALQDNALTTTVLALALSRRWPTVRTVLALDEWVWRRQLARSRSRPSVGQLAETRSPEMLALVGDAYRARVAQMQRELDEARDDTASARTALRTAQQEIERLTAELRNSHATTNQLRQDLTRALEERDEVRERARINDVHAVDDYEQLRTRMVRALRDRTKMLEDALHAVRNERYLVTEEFVERVVEDLKRELGRLQVPGS